MKFSNVDCCKRTVFFDVILHSLTPLFGNPRTQYDTNIRTQATINKSLAAILVLIGLRMSAHVTNHYIMYYMYTVPVHNSHSWDPTS